ncbi:carbohydrate binding domain-containing protein [Streptomyces sp. WMMC897]|uniref:carbohydrate binding domain-containing protein n=1 Tax=Streptomyces sp. WMMC897 TaxID=3014782 RepID=UPI0022B677C4|nr:carbohydrate binding domain-containing protein [Streptomyces sp. WMMC897]MCZ7413162.1 carbohydrate binding domain-containing protein [Streptomyces sp. WMMC897]
MAFPDDPLDVTVELYYDGAWQDITSDVYLRDRITIERGQPDEATNSDPGSCSLTLDNRQGRYSPRNPNSPLYGKIGRNTPLRVRVGDLPPAPAVELADTFDRTVADGWGSADTGQAWTVLPIEDSSTTPHSVAAGIGSIEATTTAHYYIASEDLGAGADQEMTYTVTAPVVPGGTDSGLGVFSIGLLRVDPVAQTFYAFVVRLLADTGAPGGTGRRVGVNIYRVEPDGSSTAVAGTQNVPGLTYDVGTALRVRAQASGPELRMRVWREGEPEPLAWHRQGWDDTLTTGGAVGFGCQVPSFYASSLPLTFDYQDVSVTTVPEPSGAVRFVGEVSEWPPRWDVSGHDSHVPITASGILRRLGQGAAPLQSALRRHIPAMYPQAYWPMEDGPLAETATEATGNALALDTPGFNYGQVADLPGSAALPTLGDGARMRTTQAISGTADGSWSIHLLFRADDTVFPTSGEHELLHFFTDGTGHQVILTAGEVVPGARGLRGRVLDSDGVEIGNRVGTHENAIASGGAPLIGEWVRVRVTADDTSGDLEWRFDWIGTSLGASNWGNGATITSGTAGRITSVDTRFGSGLKGAAIGHLSVMGVAFSQHYVHGGLFVTDGFLREPAGQRVQRIASEEDLPLRVEGRVTIAVGPQEIAPALDLISEAIDVDQGLLVEQRDDVGLRYRSRRTRYGQRPALELDYAAGHIAPPLEPADDDQRLRNDVTVTQRGGSSARAIQETGPVSVQPPPDGVGRYERSTTMNVSHPLTVEVIAWWLLHLGTVDDLRYPRVHLDMAHSSMAALTAQVMLADLGDRITIANPPLDVPPGTIDLHIEATTETIGVYDWDIDVTCGPGGPWTVAGVSPGQGPDTTLAEAFEDDVYAVTITNGGDLPWTRTSAHAHTGTWSLSSGAITDNQTTAAILTVPDRATSLTFWYRTSSELSGAGFEGDYFEVLVDGVQDLRAQGEIDWTEHSVDVTEVAEVTFRYLKDNSASSGEDAAYVDDLTFTLAGTDPADDDPGVDRQPDRADTLASHLAAAATSTQTTLDVHTPLPELPWVTAAAPLNANGDFTNGLTGWTAFGGTAQVVPVDGVHPDGADWALEFTPDGIEPFPNVGSDVVAVAEGRTYTLSGWMRCASARSVALNVNWFVGGVYDSTEANEQFVQADTWTWFEQTVTAPAGIDGANAAPTVAGGAPADVLMASRVHLRPTLTGQHVDDLPIEGVTVGGEVVNVRGIAPLGHDAFTRVETDTWGTADSGQTWAAAGTASDFAVDGTSGTITLTSPVETIRRQALPEDITDAEVLVRIAVDQVATGASMLPAILLREVGADFYRARLHFGTSGQMFMSVTEDGNTVGGTTTLPYTYVVDQWFWLRARITGQTVQVKAWPDGQREPTAWQHEVEITTVVIASGSVGVTASAFSNNTNTNPVISYDMNHIMTRGPVLP